MGGKLNSKIRAIFFIKFEKKCMKVLIKAYHNVIEDNKYDVDWKEEKFSAHIFSYMEKLDLTSKHKLHINIEYNLLDINKLPIEENSPKKLPRIDISLASWEVIKDEKVKYFFEAKNLYENDYKKKKASQYINRYIDAGIENFRTGRYFNGSLVGYVLEGNIDRIIDKLNIQLTKDRKNKNKATNHLSAFEQKNPIKNFNYYCETKHLTPLGNRITIQHIFLDFSHR